MPITFSCEGCGTSFAVPPSRAARGPVRTCSQACRASIGGADTRVCEVCQGSFVAPRWQIERCGARACSKACASRLGSAARTSAALGSTFFDQLVVTSAGCLEWPHARNPGGYGDLTWRGRRWLAHRLAWTLRHGPTRLPVLHGCDNPPCCNLDHLHLGSRARNSGEMVERGRSLVGSLQPNAKLTESQVRAMRQRYRAGGISYSLLGREFGVATMTAYNAVTGRRWRHVS